VDVASLDLDLGPDPHVLALSEFVTVPGPGVVLVDLNGQGMLYSETVWMDDQGCVTGGGVGWSSTGWSLADGCVSVTGRASGVPTVAVEVTSWNPVGSLSFEVTPEPDGWYAGCRLLPDDWLDSHDIYVAVTDRH